MKRLRYLCLFFIVLTSNYYYLGAQNLSLKIFGKSDTETKIIDSIKYKSSFPNYKLLNDEVSLMDKTLQKIGFIESKLIETKKISDSVYHSFFNLKQKFYTIYIYINKKLVSDDLINPIVSNYNGNYFTIQIPDIKSTLQKINSHFSKKGLPFAKLKLENIEKRGEHDLQADLIVDENSRREIDKIVIKGYEQFPKSFVKHFLKIKHNELFDLNEIKQKTGRLNDLPFTSQIKSPEVLFTKDSTSLYVYLKKTKSNTFDGFLGFGTNETTNKIEFDGYLNLILINNLNYGEQFSLIYKSDEINQKTFDANLNLPYLFGLPLGTEFSLNIFKKDSTFTTVSQNAHVFYQANPKNKIYAGISAVQSNNLLNESLSENLSDYNSIFYRSRYIFRKNQNLDLLFPINLSINASLGFGNRESEVKNEQQIKARLAMSKIFNLDNKSSFYLNADAKTLLSDSYLLNELYRFGGINSIRGFEENSIEASQYGLINLEYRYRLNSGIYIHTITDAAYFENKITQTEEKLFGFGFGFGILTKTGLLKLNYANGKNENQKFKLSNSKIHISLNAIF